MTIITHDERDAEFFRNRKYAGVPCPSSGTTFDGVKDDDADEWADLRLNDPEYTNPDPAASSHFVTEDAFDIEFFLGLNVALLETNVDDPDHTLLTLDVPYHLLPIWQVTKSRLAQATEGHAS